MGHTSWYIHTTYLPLSALHSGAKRPGRARFCFHSCNARLHSYRYQKTFPSLNAVAFCMFDNSIPSWAPPTCPQRSRPPDRLRSKHRSRPGNCRWKMKGRCSNQSKAKRATVVWAPRKAVVIHRSCSLTEVSFTACNCMNCNLYASG